MTIRHPIAFVTAYLAVGSNVYAVHFAWRYGAQIHTEYGRISLN